MEHLESGDAPRDRSVVALLKKLTAVLAASENLDDFFVTSVDLIANSLFARGSSIFLMDREDGLLKIKASTTIPVEEWPKIAIKLGEGIVGKVAYSGQTIWAKDIAAETGALPRYNEERQNRYKTRSFISVPIRLQEHTFGVINVDSRSDGKAFTHNDVKLMESLSGMFASVLATQALLNERQRANMHLDSILQGVQLGVITFDNHLHVTHANRESGRLLDFDSAACRHAPANLVLNDSIRTTVLEMVAGLKKTEMPAYREIEIAANGATEKKVLGLTASALRSGLKKPDGVILAIEDLALREENQQLRESAEQKSHFLSLISHELRTPLTSIQGAVHLLNTADSMKMNEQQRKFLAIVDRNVRRLSDLVNNILEVQSIEADRVKLDWQDVDLCEVIGESIEDRKKHWGQKDVRLSFLDGEACPLRLRLDRSRTRQIFDHLIDNAYKFCPTCGVGRIELFFEGSEVCVRVTNSGEPIAPPFRDKIFDKFYQIESTMTRNISGSGLGLYVARQLARLQGGDVELERSEPGETAFLVRLPRSMNGSPTNGVH